MPVRRRPTVAILLLLGLLALVVAALPFVGTAAAFGAIGLALLLYYLAGLGVSYIEALNDPAVDRRQTRRLLGGQLLLTVLYFALELRAVPSLMPYTPVREQALYAFAFVPPLLPWLFRFLRNAAFVQSGRALPLALLLVVALLLLGPFSRPLRSLFVLPPEFTGSVVIELADDTCPPTPVRGGYRRFVIPPSGQLCARPEAGWTMHYCTGERCATSWDLDRWVYAGDESHPLSTWGGRPVITAINLGARTEQHRGNQVLYRTQKLTFTVNPP